MPEKKKTAKAASKAFDDTTVIIPTLNEALNIGRLVKLLRKLYPGIRIIVADDGSRDDTLKIARSAGAAVVDRKAEKTKGITASVVDAAKAAKTEFFVVIDADFQHPPEKIKDIIAKLREGNKVVVAVREKIDSKWSMSRKFISKSATMLGRLKLLGRKFSGTDIMSGFFGCNREYFLEVYGKNQKRFVHEGFKVLFDLLKCMPKDAPVGEVGYYFGTRSHGNSKIGKKHVFF
jgi:dolichol-phosphate mannosyltransferase